MWISCFACPIIRHFHESVLVLVLAMHVLCMSWRFSTRYGWKPKFVQNLVDLYGIAEHICKRTFSACKETGLILLSCYFHADFMQSCGKCFVPLLFISLVSLLVYGLVYSCSKTHEFNWHSCSKAYGFISCSNSWCQILSLLPGRIFIFVAYVHSVLVVKVCEQMQCEQMRLLIDNRILNLLNIAYNLFLDSNCEPFWSESYWSFMISWL